MHASIWFWSYYINLHKADTFLRRANYLIQQMSTLDRLHYINDASKTYYCKCSIHSSLSLALVTSVG